MEFVQVQDGNNAEQIIFFVHGFKPLKLLKRKKTFIQEYKNYLTNVGFDGRVIFCLWKSTGIPFLPLPLQHQLLLKPLDFKIAERKARKEGQVFFDSIYDRYGSLAQKDVFLIGHSLGTLLIHEALSSGNDKSKSYLQIKDVIYLASAVPVIEDNKWFSALSAIKGKIFSCYSPKDGWLGKTPDFKKRIGKIRLNHKSERIIDAHCKNYGHNDYLKKMRRVLRKWHFRTYSKLSLLT